MARGLRLQLGMPHEAALRLLQKGQIGETLAHYYRRWYEHPELVAIQMQGISKGRAPGMEGQIGHLPDKRPYLVLEIAPRRRRFGTETVLGVFRRYSPLPRWHGGTAALTP